MKLVVISSKICWQSDSSASGYVTDGGFPLQMEAISELFTETRIAVPCEETYNDNGVMPLKGYKLQVIPLSTPRGQGMRRKLSMLNWLFKNGYTIWQKVKEADAIHAPIPGDVGTIGIFFALLQRKPLFVRHCGNWLVQRTIAEKFWLC